MGRARVRPAGGPKPEEMPRAPRTRKQPKPRMADCSEPIVTQPVCSPKYMLLKHISPPTSPPTMSALAVSSGSCCPGACILQAMAPGFGSTPGGTRASCAHASWYLRSVGTQISHVGAYLVCIGGGAVITSVAY